MSPRSYESGPKPRMGRSIHGRVCVCVCVCLALVSIGFAPPDLAEPAFANDTPSASADTQGFVGDDFNDVLEVLDLESLATSLQAKFRDRYGDMWIDRAQRPSVLKVNLVGPITDEDRAVLSTATGGNSRILLNLVVFSQAEISRYHALLKQVMAGEIGPWTVGEDASQNRLVVAARSLRPETLAQIVSTVPLQAVSIELSEEFYTRNAHSSRDVYGFAHEGGLYVWIERPPPFLPGTWGGCTTGYTIRKDSAFYGLTAGHCSFSSASTAVRVGGTEGALGTYVGTSSSNTYWCCDPSNSDAVKYSMTASEARGYILANNNHHRAVRRQINEAGMPYGYSVCWSGRTTGFERCGNINRTNVSYTDENDRTLFHAYCWNGTALGGDSGGPVYHVRGDLGADATGIVKGITPVIIGGQTVADTCMSTLQQSIPGVGGTGLYTI